MKIKMKFHRNGATLDATAVDKKYKLIAMVLEGVSDIEEIDEVITAINDIQNTDKTWEMGYYNDLYINIKKHRVRIVDALRSSDNYFDVTENYNIKFTKVSGNFTNYIDIEPNLFKKILLEWRSYIERFTSANAYKSFSYHNKGLIRFVEFDL